MKNIKQILSSVLVLVLVLASVSAITAFAADGDPTLVLTSAEAEKGETVYLELSLENDAEIGIYAILIGFKYDTDALTLVTRKATKADPVGQSNLSEYFTDFTAGKNMQWYGEEEDITVSETLGSIPFIVAEDAAPGVYEIQLVVSGSIYGVNNYDGDTVDVNTVNGYITVKGAEPEVPTYTVPVDGQGNALNPYFVNGNIWTETDGTMVPAPGTMENFIFFDNALANNRIEATFRNLPYTGEGNTRNGIVFAVTDNNDDHLTGIDDGGANYYWVCVSGYGEVQLIGFPGWKNYTVGGIVDITKDVTLAVEWDAEGNVKVFANGELRIVKNVGEPLTGNLYGILMRSHANTEDGGFTHNILATSFVAGGANEVPKQVTVTADPEVGGTVTGAGDYYLGQNATVTATPNAGYNFAGWFWNGTLVSSDLTFTFPAGDFDLVAKFTNITYDVTVNAGANGTAAGTGTYAEGANVTVTATANAGYKFVGWYVNDVKVSADATYTFAAAADVTLVAEFEKVEYTVATDANGNLLTPHFVNGINWELSEGQLFLYDGTGVGFLLFDDELNANRIETTMVVRDNETGYHGDKRYGVVFALTDHDGDNSFTNGTDVSYYWAFINTWGHVEIRKMGKYQGWTVIGSSPTPISTIKTGVNLVVEWDDNGHIVVYADGTVVIDITDTTDPLNGNLYGLYAVKHWNHAADPTVTDAYYTSFIAGTNTANITVNATEGGVVTGAGEYEIGKGATLTATANDGYKFIGWFIGDELVSEAATFIYTVEADAELVAKFEALVYYDVTVDATEGGNATGANTVLAGNTVTVIATPNAGYHFLGWFVNGEIVSTETTYEFAPTADIALEARFEKDEEPAAGLETEVESESGETVTGVTVNTDKDGYTIGEEFSVTVNVTNNEYMFIGWYQDGIFRSADLTYTDTYFEGISLVAKVVKKPENNGFAYIFGYTDEIMGAEGTLLRGEAAQIIYRLFAQAGAVNLGEGFEDMDGWYQNGLLYVSGKGLWSTSNSAYPYAVVSKGEVYKVICIGYGLTTDGSLSYSEYATILKNAGYLAEIPADLGTAILRYEFCEIINKITGRDQYDLVDKDSNVITAEDYGFTDLDEADPYYKTMLIATSNFANGYVDLAGRADRDELDKVKKDEE